MSRPIRSNPLALAVLLALIERPMHPYEVATTLRRRHKDDSVRLNYGALYRVVTSLERRRLIATRDTEREGRLPERTVYEITEAGRIEAFDWLSGLVSTPTLEYPDFLAALSFLTALPQGAVEELLDERVKGIELLVSQWHARRELLEKHRLPRVLWVEDQYRVALWEAELVFVRQLLRDMRSGTLEGLTWWRLVHEEPEKAFPAPWGSPEDR